MSETRLFSRRGALAGAAATGLALGLGPWDSAWAKRVFPKDGVVNYRVLRWGREVGSRRLNFSRDGSWFRVRTAFDVDTAAAGLAPYRFRHRCEEQWRDGVFLEVASDTEENGEQLRLRAAREERTLVSEVNGKVWRISGYIITSSLWHRDTPLELALFDTVGGRIKRIKGARVGEEAVATPQGSVQADIYAIWGQLSARLWYGPDCSLVKARLRARDGAPLELHLA